VVFGLFVLSQLGRLMMRIGFNSSGNRSSRSRDEGGGMAVIGIAGLGIMVTGGLGVLIIFFNYVGWMPGGTSNGILLLGLGSILGGIITATQYH